MTTDKPPRTVTISPSKNAQLATSRKTNERLRGQIDACRLQIADLIQENKSLKKTVGRYSMILSAIHEALKRASADL